MFWLASTIILAFAAGILALLLFKSLRSQYILRHERRRLDISRLASYVSHDLRNPLSIVVAYAQLLAKQARAGAYDARTNKQIEGIQRAADRLDLMVQNLSDVAKLEVDDLRLDLSNEDLNVVLTDALDAMNYLVVDKHIDMKVEIRDVDLPLISIDRRRVLHALRASLHNALEFSPKGGSVFVQSCRTDRGIEFTIADEGPDISARDLDKIFERPWAEVHESRAHPSLSLYVARAAIERHGGSLVAVANGFAGKGARFVLTIPLSGAPGASVTSGAGSAF